MIIHNLKVLLMCFFFPAASYSLRFGLDPDQLVSNFSYAYEISDNMLKPGYSLQPLEAGSVASAKLLS